MKKPPISAFYKFLTATFLIGGCGLFGGKEPCENPSCPDSDFVFINYRSAANGSANLFDSGLYKLDELSLSPILLDKNGPLPIITKTILPSGFHTVNVRVNENLRGIALQLANFGPDTILMTTGLAPAADCCPNPPVTISQLLANGQPILSIGAIISVDFFK